MTASFFVINKKECRLVILAQEDSKSWHPDSDLDSLNETLIQLAKEHFVIHYYDSIQINHSVIISVGILMLVLSIVNIAPGQEDLRFGFHLLVS